METRCLTSIYITSGTEWLQNSERQRSNGHPSTGAWVQVSLDSEVISPGFVLAPSPTTLLRTSQLQTGSDSCPSGLFLPQVGCQSWKGFD